MANFRQRMAVQRNRTSVSKKKEQECDNGRIIDGLRHDLHMYKESIKAFEKDSDEWKICMDSIYDLISEIAKLEQKGGGGVEY